MKLSLREAAIVASRLCLALAAVWIGAPQFMLWVEQIDGGIDGFFTSPVGRGRRTKCAG